MAAVPKTPPPRRETTISAADPFAFDPNAPLPDDAILRKSGASRAIFLDAGKKHNINPAVLWAIAQRESSGNPNAMSSAGASGLMGLMGPTAAEVGVTDPTDPSQAIPGAARYLRGLYDRWIKDTGGDATAAQDKTWQSYNAGRYGVMTGKNIGPQARAYPKQIREAYNKAYGVTPPTTGPLGPTTMSAQPNWNATHRLSVPGEQPGDTSSPGLLGQLGSAALSAGTGIGEGWEQMGNLASAGWNWASGVAGPESFSGAVDQLGQDTAETQQRWTNYLNTAKQFYGINPSANTDVADAEYRMLGNLVQPPLGNAAATEMSAARMAPRMVAKEPPLGPITPTRFGYSPEELQGIMARGWGEAEGPGIASFADSLGSSPAPARTPPSMMNGNAYWDELNRGIYENPPAAPQIPSYQPPEIPASYIQAPKKIRVKKSGSKGRM